MSRQHFILGKRLQTVLAITMAVSLISLSQSNTTASTLMQEPTVTAVAKPTDKANAIYGPALPRHTIYTFRAYGFVLVVEHSEDKTGQYTLSVTYQNKGQRVGINEPLLVSEKFSARSVSKTLSEEIANPVLDTGKLYAAILPETDPVNDGITLVFVTKGKLNWCGLNIATTQPKHQFVFMARLRQQTSQLTWQLNLSDEFMQQLEPIETRGWLETYSSATQIIDVRKGAPTPIPAPLKERIILHTTEQDYSLNFLGVEKNLQFGVSQQYRVRGFKCQLPGAADIFSPTQRIHVSSIEKI
jgi:hypothetical protein